MTYLFYGTDEYFIQKEIGKIIKEKAIEEISISRYDLEQHSLKDILEDAQTVSLFSSEKMILVNNAFFFGTVSKKNSIDEQDMKDLENYLKQENDSVILIFVTDKVNMTKKISKLLKKVGVVKEFTSNGNPNHLVKELLNGYQISDTTIKLLISRVGSNTNLLQQECQKLKSYKLDEKIISDEDIMELVHKNIDLDIFKLIDSIILKNKEDAMETITEMLKYNEEPIKIIIMLANQFRLMYQSKVLIKKGYSEQEIAKKLNVHPYPVKLALMKARNFKEDTLLKLLEQLADLDFEIKSGKIEKSLALDLFIMGL